MYPESPTIVILLKVQTKKTPSLIYYISAMMFILMVNLPKANLNKLLIFHSIS